MREEVSFSLSFPDKEVVRIYVSCSSFINYVVTLVYSRLQLSNGYRNAARKDWQVRFADKGYYSSHS